MLWGDLGHVLVAFSDVISAVIKSTLEVTTDGGRREVVFWMVVNGLTLDGQAQKGTLLPEAGLCECLGGLKNQSSGKGILAEEE